MVKKEPAVPSIAVLPAESESYSVNPLAATTSEQQDNEDSEAMELLAADDSLASHVANLANPSSKSTEVLYDLAEHAQSLLKMWQDEWILLERTLAHTSRRPARDPRRPMNPVVYEDQKAAVLYGYKWDPNRAKQGRQDFIRPRRRNVINGRELRYRGLSAKGRPSMSGATTEVERPRSTSTLQGRKRPEPFGEENGVGDDEDREARAESAKGHGDAMVQNEESRSRKRPRLIAAIEPSAVIASSSTLVEGPPRKRRGRPPKKLAEAIAKKQGKNIPKRISTTLALAKAVSAQPSQTSMPFAPVKRPLKRKAATAAAGAIIADMAATATTTEPSADDYDDDDEDNDEKKTKKRRLKSSRRSAAMQAWWDKRKAAERAEKEKGRPKAGLEEEVETPGEGSEAEVMAAQKEKSEKRAKVGDDKIMKRIEAEKRAMQGKPQIDADQAAGSGKERGADEKTQGQKTSQAEDEGDDEQEEDEEDDDEDEEEEEDFDNENDHDWDGTD